MSLPPKFLMISRHDYRSRRRANVHFIARELALLGTMRMFSSSFSWLSRLTHDQRLPLWREANRVSVTEGVEAYLWRTAIHPCKVPPWLDFAMDGYFRQYIRTVPKILRDWITESDVVFLESGGPEIFFELIREINPRCKIVYICSDDLKTIGTSRFVRDEFARIAGQFDGVRLPSRLLASEFPDRSRLHFVPHGIDAAGLQTDGGNPYAAGRQIVSVGNMLFDPQFFRIAAQARPDIHFHVIGGGPGAAGLGAAELGMPNITVYGEMPFGETLRYIKHADAGVAPYVAEQAAPYLTDTSMKLMQYRFFGLPAICPDGLAAGHSDRFGYTTREPGSVMDAIGRALAYGRFKGPPFLSWAEVAQRLLHPEHFPDTFMS